MKHKKLTYRLVIIGLLILAAASILLISGFRLTSMQAARTSFGLNSTSQYVDEVDYKNGKVYLFKNADSYQSIVTERTLFLWKSSANIVTNQNSDKVRLIGWCSLNESGGGVTVIHVESFDKSVRYIEMGKSNLRIRKYVTDQKPLVFFWNTGLAWNDLNGIAYSQNNKPLYQLGYQIINNTIDPKLLRWLPVNN